MQSIVKPIVTLRYFNKLLGNTHFDSRAPVHAPAFTRFADKLNFIEDTNMAQEIKKINDEEFELTLSDDDLAIFYRVFGQEPKEAMRIAGIFEEEEMAFAAMSQDIRKQILAQVDPEELKVAVDKIEKEALDAA